MRSARVALLLVAIVVGLPVTAAHADEYVALGDSFAAGPLIPVQMPPFGCLKSSNNYGQLAAVQLGHADQGRHLQRRRDRGHDRAAGRHAAARTRRSSTA